MITRERILSAAFDLVLGAGFGGVSVDSIVAGAGVTKGAFYHHFASKKALGRALIEEVVGPRILAERLAPLQRSPEPLAALLELVRWAEENVTDRRLATGCPLNNLAQEISSIDEGMRRAVAGVLDHWTAGLAAEIRRAQEVGSVRPDLEPLEIATFLVASWQGAMGTVKATRDRGALRACRVGLETYLDAVRTD